MVASDPQKDPSVYDNLQQSLFCSRFYCKFRIPNSHAPNIIHRKISMITSKHRTKYSLLFITFVCCKIEITSRLMHIVEWCTVHRTQCPLVHCTMCNAWINPYNNWYAFIVWLLAAHKNENKSFMISSFFCLLLFNSLYTLIPFNRTKTKKKKKNDWRKCYRNMKKRKKKYCIV